MTSATFDLIVDAGNGFTKAALVKGRTLVATTRYPSLLRFTSDSLFVYGGFTLSGISCVVGSDCDDRDDAIVVGDDSNGKVKYLAHLVAGAISAFNTSLPVGSNIRIHLLTLSFDRKADIEKAVARLASLVIDNIDKQLTVTLADLLPEGVGCSSYAASVFKQAKSLSVLDVGSGTMNLSSYAVERRSNQACVPRRTSFRFEGIGISTLEKFLVAHIKDTTTNGQVDRRLVSHALQSNTYRMLDSYDGTDIKPQLTKAIEQWLRLPETKDMLTKVIFTLQTGGFVSTCGGGFLITAVREAIETNVLANVDAKSAERWLIPSETDVLGVVGTAKLIAGENRRTQLLANKENKPNDEQPKPRSQRKRKEQAQDTQHNSGTPGSVSGDEGVSTGEQPPTDRIGEPSTQGMVAEQKQPSNT